MVVVAGEITTTAIVDYPKIIRQAITDIGYTDSSMGFDAATCAVLTAIEQQSPDIAQGVRRRRRPPTRSRAPATEMPHVRLRHG